MIRIGLTGTLGAGKSTVGDLFEAWGARRVDADRLAREAVRPGSPALEAIRDRWGSAVLTDAGELDRETMRQVAFADPEERKVLEALLHPQIRRLLEREEAVAAEAGTEIFVAEIPLLFESGLQDRFDLTLCVDAPREFRERRVSESRGLGAGEFAAMEAAQWPPERKRAAADRVLVNDADPETLRERARALWSELTEKGR